MPRSSRRTLLRSPFPVDHWSDTFGSLRAWRPFQRESDPMSEEGAMPTRRDLPPHPEPDTVSPSLAPIHSRRRLVHERAREIRPQKWRLVVLCLLLFLPSFFLPYELTNDLVMYQQMQAGLSHLQAALDLFHGTSRNGIPPYFDVGTLRAARAEIDTAHAEFVSLDDRLEQDSATSLASLLLPAQISTARALVHIATEGTTVAQVLFETLKDLAPSIASAIQQSVLSADPPVLPPFLTPSSYQEINRALAVIAPHVHQMALSAQEVSLDAFPLSSKQQATLASILPLLPALDGFLAQRSTFQDPLGWFLGIDQQRSFLVETMDSAELRATGGFTGQFGELVLNGAHIGPLKLSNIGAYEEDLSSEGTPPDPTVYPKVQGQTAPSPYSSWWPTPNFGMRDANLSADFPTSARLIMERYRYEFGRNVDGVVLFTPTFIRQVLHVTGPIPIPAYHQTVTEQNLEDLLHYYQLDAAGIAQEEQVEHVTDIQIARKLFTQRVTTALINAVTHLPPNQLLALVGGMFQSMKSKDLQIYVTNPQLEAVIGKYGSTASLDRSASHDGFFIVQSNLSASKASQYVTTSIQDTIQLDSQGGATHHLQVTLAYLQKGPVYGYSTYRDYVRIYVPPSSQLLSGNGFDQVGQPYCGDSKSRYPLCQPDVYGDGSLVCTAPLSIGGATPYLSDPYAGTDHPLDVTGPPTNRQSDESGRAMFGGWVVVPNKCTMKVTLTWYVPPMGQQPYHLLLQAQASVYGPLDLTVQPSAGTCAGKPLHFSRTMDGEDLLVTLKQQGAQCSLASGVFSS
jgi:hypothetical protein